MSSQSVEFEEAVEPGTVSNESRALSWAPSRTYWVCAVAALGTIWFHRYPAGLDLSQHANLFQVLAKYNDPHSGYRFFYSLDFFTPYAVTYLVAWPLAKLGGALFATKVLLSASVLATPLLLSRWLRLVGTDPSLGLLGFVIAFGFPYQWGFLSFLVATPVSFAYMAAAEELRQKHSAKRLLAAAGLATLLFFSHGATFFVVMLSSGLSFLLQRNVKKAAFELMHFVAPAAVLVPWYLSHRKDAVGGYEYLPTTSRIVLLFAGIFQTSPSYIGAVSGFALVVLFFVVGKPSVSSQPSRFLPLLVALLGLFSVPDTVGGTLFVGTRFAHFVYCFVLPALDFRKDVRGLRLLRRVSFAISLVVIIAMNYRLWVFNQELRGLSSIKTQIPKGSDLQIFEGHHESDTFGFAAHSHAGAWISAEQGGFLQNDHGRYFQIPVQRRGDIPWPSEYPYLVTRGSRTEALAELGKSGVLSGSGGAFYVFEAPVTHLEVPGMKLVRFAEAWGTPRLNLSVGAAPLTVGGRKFETGIGAHARSVLEMRVDSKARHVRGAVGMDEEVTDVAACVFTIADAARRQIWKSHEHRQGDAPEAFDVPWDGAETDLFLVTEPAQSDIQNAHTDWLEIAAVP